MLLIPFFNSRLNKKMMLLYSIVYIVGHQITYDPEHELHHKKPSVNYGPHGLDILFGTYQSP